MTRLQSQQINSYVCTFNDWYDIWSLGRTVHPETDGIWYEVIKAKTRGQAKQMFLRQYGESTQKYTDVKARLLKNSQLVTSIQQNYTY